LNGEIDELPTDPEPVPPRYSTKPDPDEPFRYVCPECERQVYREPKDSVYRCEGCGEGYKMDGLLDLKTEKTESTDPQTTV